MATAAIPLRKDNDADPRAALKHAVAEAQKARAAVDKQRDAIERGKQLVQEAGANLAAARANVATATKGRAQDIAKTIAGGGSPSSTGTIRAARAAEQSCEDELEATKGGALALEADLADLESAAAVAARAVDRVLAAALRPTALALLQQVRDQRLRLLTTREALTALGRLWDPWDEIVKQIDRSGSPTEADVRLSIATRQQWQAAIEALKLDADAELPDLAGD